MIKQMNILEIANSFLKYFVKGIEDIKLKCKYTSTESAMTTEMQLPARQLEIANSSLYIPNASIISIGKIIDQIKVNKSPGYERLRMKDLTFFKGRTMFKNYRPIANLSILTELFNLT